MFDTCISDTGTIETNLNQLSIHDPVYARFSRPCPDPIDITTETVMLSKDSLGECRFTGQMDIVLEAEAVGTVKGWNFTSQEANTWGLRTANVLRAFNVRHGLTPNLEYPSRHCSTPVDGPAKGKSIIPYWERMLDNHKLMGWDKTTGKPLRGTLRNLDHHLQHIVRDPW